MKMDQDLNGHIVAMLIHHISIFMYPFIYTHIYIYIVSGYSHSTKKKRY